MKIDRDLKNLTAAILLIYGLFAGFYLLEQQAENAAWAPTASIFLALN